MKPHATLFRVLSIAALLAAPLAQAESLKRYFHVSSGSGFFVGDGYALTNEHVVRGCTQAIIKGPDFAETLAEVRAADAQHDLALLTTSAHPRAVAALEGTDTVEAGEKLLVIGYPGDAWKTGQYKAVEAALVDKHGPQDHPDWVQFSDVVQHGNSGGPLLDASGNVIGVVAEIAWQEQKQYLVNQRSGERRLVSDTVTKRGAAVNVSAMQAFLRRHGVAFRSGYGGVHLTPAQIEQHARDYVLNVQCRLPISAAEAAATSDSG